MWQSSNEGYTWMQLFPGTKFLVFYLHTYTHDRAYLITDSAKFYYTTDAGRQWNSLDAPLPPNTFSAQVLHFQPQSDYLIWTGDAECSGGGGPNCHAEAYYSRDNGRRWQLVETYVRNCAWARDSELKLDPTQILCESYRDKKGSQRFLNENPMELVGGTNFFQKKTKLFDQVVGFAKFSEFLVVAEVGLGSVARLRLDLSILFATVFTVAWVS
jgi:Sortilin, neurotensin receptor 3,